MSKQTIQIADKDTLDKVKKLLTDEKYGLSNLKKLLSEIGDSQSSNVKCLLGEEVSSLPKTTLPYDFYNGSAVVLNDEIHILGGSGNNKAHYKWNGFEWIEVSTLPYNFDKGTSVVYNNEIHILGGNGNTTAHYMWNGTSWTSVSTLPEDFVNTMAVVYNNEIHMLRPYSKWDISSGSHIYYIKHYKWDGTSWSLLSTRSYTYNAKGYKAVVWNNEIHVLGGKYDDGGGKYHYKWDGSTWSSVSTLPYNFCNGAVVVLNNEIHIFGNAIDKNAHYKWTGTEWVSDLVLPYYFYDGSAVVSNNEIHLLGGGGTGYYTSHHSIFGSAYKKSQKMYLLKNSKIYSPVSLSSLTNCYYDNGHLTVVSDGYVDFAVDSTSSSVLLKIV